MEQGHFDIQEKTYTHTPTNTRIKEEIYIHIRWASGFRPKQFLIKKGKEKI